MAYDVVIAGGGILGCSLAYWISGNYYAKIAVLEKNDDVGKEQSTRNTGTLHRPFYLDPEKRKKFAISANWGYELWKKIAREDGLGWKEAGTLELALREGEVGTLEKYKKWAYENGMNESEVRIFSDDEVRGLRPNIKAAGAMICNTDVSVDFGSFTNAMKERALDNGVEFWYDSEVEKIDHDGHVTVYLQGGDQIEASRLINTAGNFAVDLAHMCGKGLNYTDLNFRGDYWKVNPEFGRQFPWNVYTVPRHSKYQFLDPHLIVKADRSFDIGPSALLVPDAMSYDDPLTIMQTFSPTNMGKFAKKMIDPPIGNKAKLFLSKEFMVLALNELKHLGREGMVSRIRSFIPMMSPEYIIGRGVSGIRSSVVNEKGGFEPEALLIDGGNTFHVLAYNSPGASGAPGFAGYMIGEMRKTGFLDGLVMEKRRQLADIEEIIESF